MTFTVWEPCYQCGEPATKYTSRYGWFCENHHPIPPIPDPVGRLCMVASWYRQYKVELSAEARAELDAVLGWVE